MGRLKANRIWELFFFSVQKFRFIRENLKSEDYLKIATHTFPCLKIGTGQPKKIPNDCIKKVFCSSIILYCVHKTNHIAAVLKHYPPGFVL